jgi:hypothetical protein
LYYEVKNISLLDELTIKHLKQFEINWQEKNDPAPGGILTQEYLILWALFLWLTIGSSRSRLIDDHRSFFRRGSGSLSLKLVSHHIDLHQEPETAQNIIRKLRLSVAKIATSSI